MKRTIFPLFIVLALLAAACSGGSQKKSKNAINESQQSKLSSDDSKTSPGEAVFKSYCLACHQADGSGVPGMYPPLSPNEFVKDKDKMIHIVLNGLKGEIEVNGEVYNNLMAPHSQLSNKDLADVLSYVRSHFGNDLGAVTEEEIAAARKK